MRSPPKSTAVRISNRNIVAAVMIPVFWARMSTPWWARRQAMGSGQKDSICNVGRVWAAMSVGILISCSTTMP